MASYNNQMPKKMTTFFREYDDAGSAPSFQKFADSAGITADDVERFRSHQAFERAYRACREIRRDYLIDRALCKRFDASLVKFLLDTEFPAEKGSDDKHLSVTLDVPA